MRYSTHMGNSSIISKTGKAFGRLLRNEQKRTAVACGVFDRKEENLILFKKAVSPVQGVGITMSGGRKPPAEEETITEI